MAQLTESDKALNAYESKNTSLESYILVTSEGVPFKFAGVKHEEAIKYSGLMYDLIHYSKRILEDLKKGNSGNISLRLRLKDGHEYIIQQELDFFLITVQMCKAVIEEEQPNK
jgi:hypothetical protein